MGGWGRGRGRRGAYAVSKKFCVPSWKAIEILSVSPVERAWRIVWGRNRLVKALKQCLTEEDISFRGAGFHWSAKVLNPAQAWP